MKILSKITYCRLRFALLAIFITSAATFSLPTLAAPGAHGPGGEHLDAPGTTATAGSSTPRAESKSETFELVARLEGGALSILIDRYDTNEPVLGASVDIESAGAKAKASFRAEQGDYIVTEPAMLKLLAGPGTHSLIFTISAGKDSDLLDAKLIPGSAADSHDSGTGASPVLRGMLMAAWVGAVVLGVAVVVYFFRRRRSASRIAYPRAGGV